jgi:hypothetical protein
MHPDIPNSPGIGNKKMSPEKRDRGDLPVEKDPC